MGRNAADLLGQDCILSPGDYELCVQFFVFGPKGIEPVSDEKCKPFTIKGNDQQVNYQPPRNVSPVDGTKFNVSDFKKAMTFIWIPINPKTQEPVTYKLKVWQLMQNQTSVQAIKSNQPIIEKDIDNLTQTFANLNSDPCRPPYTCNFVWNVQALSRDGKPIGANNGLSESSQFSANICDVNLILKLKSIECISTTNEITTYKICISSTYSSPIYNLKFTQSGSGLKAYAINYNPNYSIVNLSPNLSVQNSGSSTTVDYCFETNVPSSQTAIKVGLQGDDNDPGPIVCSAGAEIDIKLPTCKSCDCGKWGPILINRLKYDCGGKVEWKCNQTINFSNTFQCSADNANCQAKINWTITKDGVPYQTQDGDYGSFTPTSNGYYTITFFASCNGLKCPPCTFTIVVDDCNQSVCNCSFTPFFEYKLNNGKTLFKNPVCGDVINLPFGNYSAVIIPNFQCKDKSGKDCKGAIQNVTIIKPDNNIQSLTAADFAYTFTLPGTYQYNLSAICDGKKCECNFKVVIATDTASCKCGNWKSSYIQYQSVTPAKQGTVNCNDSITLPVGTYTFTAPDYNCSSGSCLSYDWTFRTPNNSQLIQRGSNALPLDFSNGYYGGYGTYKIYITAKCGNKVCGTCSFKVVVNKNASSGNGTAKKIAFSWKSDYYVNRTDILEFFRTKELIIRKGEYKYDYSINPYGDVIQPLAIPIKDNGVEKEGIMFDVDCSDETCKKEGEACYGNPGPVKNCLIKPVIKNGFIIELILSFRNKRASTGIIDHP